MTPTEILPWLSTVIAAIALLGHLKGWVNSGEKQLSKNIAELKEKQIEDVTVISTAITKVDQKLIEHDRRIQTVESELRHMPSKETTHQLERTMERILGRLDTMDERLKPIAATNHRLQEYLLEQVQK
ncbi:DUF2730 family protein [Agrobacterium tumefaciens]|nr:DUF2730 family protein [Agrobacterium tumefaciens]